MGSADDGTASIDNNPVENQIRPWALGCSKWLLVDSGADAVCTSDCALRLECSPRAWHGGRLLLL
nr:IS66 family transposase [Pseudomonas putida]